MKTGRIIYQFEKWMIAVVFTFMLSVSFAQVIGRYFFNTGWAWIPEMTIFACITLTYLGASTGIISDVHIGVDVITSLFPKWTHRYFEMFSDLCGIGLFSFTSYISLELILYFREMGNESLVMPGLPLWVLICYMPLGFLFMAYHSVEKLWSKVTNSPAPNYNEL